MKHLTAGSVQLPRATEPNVTLLLSNNTPEGLRQVMLWAYPQLHDIAVHYFRHEPAGSTLQPTALVHETCIRFLEGPTAFKNRRYFFAAAARAMRRLLVESARSRRAKKRGGHWQRVDFTYAEEIGFEHPSELLDLDSALKRLQASHPAWSDVTELRIFGRLSARDAAQVLGIGESTARRYFALARKWLRRDMAQTSQDARGRQPVSSKER